jgi:hypothetical protein
VTEAVLALLVGAGVDDQHQPRVVLGLGELGGHAPVPPQVLADQDRHVHPAHVDPLAVRARREDPLLVEDAGVGQVVLGVAGDHPAAVDDRGAVLAGQARQARPLHVLPGRVHVLVQVADHDRHLAVPVGVDEPGQVRHRPPARRRRTTAAGRGPRPGTR